jgi:putative sterol carrier protein
MPDVDYDPDQLLFPSQAWFAAYREALNDDETYEQASEGWGEGFNGDFVFEMRGLPVGEMDTETMPEYLQTELDAYVKETADGYVGRGYLGLGSEGCTEARLLEPDENADAGFVLSATADQWKAMFREEVDVVEGLLSGDFELEGDMQKVMQYTDAAVRMAEVASSVDAEFADEQY